MQTTFILIYWLQLVTALVTIGHIGDKMLIHVNACNQCNQSSPIDFWLLVTPDFPHIERLIYTSATNVTNVTNSYKSIDIIIMFKVKQGEKGRKTRKMNMNIYIFP